MEKALGYYAQNDARINIKEMPPADYLISPVAGDMTAEIFHDTARDLLGSKAVQPIKHNEQQPLGEDTIDAKPASWRAGRRAHAILRKSGLDEKGFFRLCGCMVRVILAVLLLLGGCLAGLALDLCSFSNKTVGNFTVPAPGCKLSQMVTVSGMMAVSGVAGASPLHELIASGNMERHFSLPAENTATLYLSYLSLTGGELSSTYTSHAATGGGNVYMSGPNSALHVQSCHFIGRVCPGLIFEQRASSGYCSDWRFALSGSNSGGYVETWNTPYLCMQRCRELFPHTTAFYLFENTKCGCSLTTSGACPVQTQLKYKTYEILSVGACASHGGSILSWKTGAVISIANSTFEGHKSKKGGGALYLYQGTVATISDTVFSSNTAGFTDDGNQYGGAIEIWTNTYVTMRGQNVFQGNSAKASYGNSLYTEATSTLTFEDCPTGLTVLPNVAALDHDFTGCPWCALSTRTEGTHLVPAPGCKLSQMVTVSGTMNVSGIPGANPLHELVAVGGTPDANNPKRHFRVNAGAMLNIEHLVLRGGRTSPYESNNIVNVVGGSIFVVGGSTSFVRIANSICKFNEAGAGGCIGSPNNEGVIELISTSFFSNRAGHGGAVWSRGDIITVKDSTFKSNTATEGAGGAISCSSGCTVKLRGGGNRFIGNKDDDCGCRFTNTFYKDGDGSFSFTTCPPGTFQDATTTSVNFDFIGCPYACPAGKTTGDEATIAALGKNCEAGTEHVDWMHLGDASGAADCLDRVLRSASAKAEDVDKRCDLESELYSFYVTGSPVGTSCLCPIVGASQAAEMTCSGNAPGGTKNVYRLSRGQAFASRRDNNPAKWCTVDCPVGYYCNGTAGGTLPCPTGSYSLAGSSSCGDCLPGRYKRPHDNDCLPMTNASCPPGYGFSSASSEYDMDTDVFFGATEDDGLCIPCPLGRWKAAENASACIPCNAGRFSNRTGETKACFPCAMGRHNAYTGMTQCSQCSPGRFANDPGLTDPFCKICDAGSFADRNGTTTCSLCPPGKHLEDLASESTAHDHADDCIDCPLAKYNPFEGHGTACFPCTTAKTTGASECPGCTMGKYKILEQGNISCPDCPRGYFTSAPNQASCTPCARGLFSTNKSSQACSSCPRGRHGTIEAAESKESGCAPCRKGTYAPEEGRENAAVACIDCVPGTWSNISGATKESQCQMCEVGRYSGRKGANNSSACRSCAAGRFSTAVGATSSETCTPCPLGEAQPSDASTFCIPCLPGRYQNQKGQPECEKCKEGRYQAIAYAKVECKLCPRGRYSKVAQSSCSLCPPGRYGGGGEGLGSETAACYGCPRGRYSPASGVASISLCVHCSPGTWSSAIAANTSTVCRSCKAGRFQSYPGNLTCDWCPLGYTSQNDGATACVPVPPGSYVNAVGMALKQCKPGYKCEGEASGMQPCPEGWYSSINGSAVCLPCSLGRFSEKMLGSALCQNCPNGWFQNAEGSSSCIRPIAGSIAAPGGVSSIPIAQGWTADKCSSDGVCSATRACAAGKYEDGTRVCQDCPAGWSSTEGNIRCDFCPKGTFAPNKASECEDCPAGWFQDRSDVASLSCQECPLGFAALKDSLGKSVKGSANCRQLNFISKCSNSEQYVNDTSHDVNEWKCEQCPTGGACEEETARWSSLRNLFGWWKIPATERSGNASWKSTPSFVECIYPPACPGASNRALEKRYYSNKGTDLALVGRENSTSPCAVSLRFRNESRLCFACNAKSRRESKARCSKCPEVEQNWSLMALGLLFAIGAVCFIVAGNIRDAGKQTLSSAIQKILLNYLQGEFFQY